MSQATASAKARRAFNPTPAPAPSSQTNSINTSNVNTQGLTLPQVISIIDNRLTNLETFMKEEKTKAPSVNNISENNVSLTDDVFSEFNHRTMLLAEEVANLKDIVLKLQSYTLEVNKTLYEERINVLSDLGDMHQTNSIETEVNNETEPETDE
jgi:hypothetical protein